MSSIDNIIRQSSRAAIVLRGCLLKDREVCCMLLCREFEGTETVICLTRTQNCRRPLGLVGGIGEMLRFKANGCTLIIFDIVLASYGSVKEVTGVYLNAGLICIHMKLQKRLRQCRAPSCGQSLCRF